MAYVKKTVYGRRKGNRKVKPFSKIYKKKTIKKAISKAQRNIFTNKVMSVIKRHTETKYAQPIVKSQTQIFAYDTVSTSTFIELTSIFGNIGQGTGQGDRVGNVISPVSFTFRGAISYSIQEGLPQTAYIVKMVIFRMKNTLSASAPDMSKFFQYGNTTQPPQNSLLDIRQKINKNDIVVYATRVFKINQASGGETGTANNDFKLTSMFSVNLTKYVRKVIYDDETLLCKNHQMFVGFLVAPYDGSTIGSSGEPPQTPTNLNIGYDIQCSYKDD